MITVFDVPSAASLSAASSPNYELRRMSQISGTTNRELSDPSRNHLARTQGRLHVRRIASAHAAAAGDSGLPLGAGAGIMGTSKYES